MPEPFTRYAALLRGINVGGANLIPMPALRAAFEALGFREVTTYIQSGNVIFTAPPLDAKRRTARIEKALSAEFGYSATIVLRSHDQMRRVVTEAPRGFGKAPHQYRYDVIFLKEPLTARDALAVMRTRDGVDDVWAGPGVLYFSRLIARASRSYLSRFASLPLYKQVTVRNWNTTTKLLQLLDSRMTSAM